MAIVRFSVSHLEYHLQNTRQWLDEASKIYHVGGAQRDVCYLVVNAAFCRRWCPGACSTLDPTKPLEAEVAIYGVREARNKTLRRFFRDACSALNSGVHVAASLYREAALQGGVEVVLECLWQYQVRTWPLDQIILTSDQTSDRQVKQRIAQYALVFALNYMGPCDFPNVSGILGRDLEDWDTLIVRRLQILHNDRSSTVTALLFRNLLYLACNKHQTSYPSYGDDRTPLENMALLGTLFEVTASNPHEFGLYDGKDIRAIVSKSEMFPFDQGPSHSEIVDGSEDIKRSLPVAIPLIIRLPQKIHHCCTYGELRSLKDFLKAHRPFAIKEPESVMRAYRFSRLII